MKDIERDNKIRFSNPIVKTNHILEKIACKLFGYDRVPNKEKIRMINRTIKVLEEYKKELS